MTHSMENTDRISILIVDDRKENLLAMEGCLEDFDLNLVKAMSGDEALERMLEEDFALVLLDVQMPGIDGFETASLMRGTERTKKVPIIFVTAISKENKHIFKGYETGAVDYLFKPLDTHMLRSKVAVFVQLHQQKNELKKTINELHHANEKIKQLSIRDALTGCFNRGYLNEQLPKEIRRSMRYETVMSLVMTDIDHFKMVNDNHVHQCGDAVLRAFADKFHSLIRKDVDWISRYGGEEFVLVLPATDLAGASMTAEKLRKTIDETPIPYKGQNITISASFGISTLESFIIEPEQAAEKLLFIADKGLYAAKNQGRNRVVTGKWEEMS